MCHTHTHSHIRAHTQIHTKRYIFHNYLEINYLRQLHWAAGNDQPEQILMVAILPLEIVDQQLFIYCTFTQIPLYHNLI